MADLKELLGESYKEDMTPEEIVAGIKSNDKIVSLTTGNYISKGKFTDLESKYADASTRLDKALNETKDMEGLKSQLEDYKAFKTDTEIKGDLLKAGLNPKFVKLGLYSYKQGEINNEGDRVKNIQGWLEKNEVYAMPKAEDKEPDKKEPEPEKKVFLQERKLGEPQKKREVKLWNRDF